MKLKQQVILVPKKKKISLKIPADLFCMNFLKVPQMQGF